MFLINITGAPTLSVNTLQAAQLRRSSDLPVSVDFDCPGIISSNFSWLMYSTSKFVPSKNVVFWFCPFSTGLSRLFRNASVSGVGLPSHNSFMAWINCNWFWRTTWKETIYWSVMLNKTLSLKLEAQWAEPVSLTFHFDLRKLYTEPSMVLQFIWQSGSVNSIWGESVARAPY